MTTAQNLILIAPEIFLSLMAFVVMLGEAFYPKARQAWINISGGSLKLLLVYYIAFFVIKAVPWASSAGVSPVEANGIWLQYPPVFGMVLVDSQAMFFKLALTVTVLLVVGFSVDYREFHNIPMGTYCSLLLFATVGMFFLVGSVDFLMAVISLELLGITSFILTGFILNRRSSSEGAIKFFLVGTFSAALLLFGVSYYYGYFGTTHLSALDDFVQAGQSPDLALNVVFIFIIAGLGFKLAMVPFHMWAPDAYEGAPTPVTAFLSVAPKVAAIGFLIRALGHHTALNMTPVLAVLAALTMTVGNIGALQQTNVKRLLAYSSVAQVGYILVAFTAGGPLGLEATLLYTFIYLFMNLGVFSVLIIISNESKSDELPTFAGLSKKSLGLASVLVLFLLSMTGIPPLAGFIGKFGIFAAVIKQSGLLWLGIVAILNSVASLFYYFRLAHQSFFVDSPEESSKLGFTPALVSSLVLTLSITVVAGLMPNQLIGWVRHVIGS